MFHKGATDKENNHLWVFFCFVLFLFFFNGKRGTGTLPGEKKQMSLLCVNLCISASP